MSQKTEQIEVELRAEISPKSINLIKNKLAKEGFLKTEQNSRLSILFLKKTDSQNIDLRVRTDTSGKSEVVIKKGNFHSHDRTEFSESIKNNQVLGIVKIFLLLDGFYSKFIERETIRFKKNDTEIAIVLAEHIAYIELEILTDGNRVDTARKKLENLAKILKLKIIQEKEFEELCGRLTSEVDKEISNNKKGFKLLEQKLKQYQL